MPNSERQVSHAISHVQNAYAFIFIMNIKGGLLARRHRTPRRGEQKMRDSILFKISIMNVKSEIDIQGQWSKRQLEA